MTPPSLSVSTRPFASEDRRRSAWHVVSSFAALGGAVALVALLPAPWRAPAALLEGLCIVRVFVLYHDFMHGALLRGSRVARALFHAYGVLVLTPPRVWRETHNYHHAHTGQLAGSHIGSFWTVSTSMWSRMTRGERLLYRAVRHPLTIGFAYGTAFLWGMCGSSAVRAPRKHWDSIVALAVHAALSAALVVWAGASIYVYTLLLPLAFACMLGAYLFYAQHNFPDGTIRPREQWTWNAAALESSSYMEMGPVMRWFTANIGFHHVHHLNPAIPFYRLPEAMAAIPELGHPGRTSLRPRDVVACLRLGVWDPGLRQMIPFREAEAQRMRTGTGGAQSLPDAATKPGTGAGGT